jgi:hypothetical protein
MWCFIILNPLENVLRPYLITGDGGLPILQILLGLLSEARGNSCARPTTIDCRRTSRTVKRRVHRFRDKRSR